MAVQWQLMLQLRGPSDDGGVDPMPQAHLTKTAQQRLQSTDVNQVNFNNGQWAHAWMSVILLQSVDALIKMQ